MQMHAGHCQLWESSGLDLPTISTSDLYTGTDDLTATTAHCVHITQHSAVIIQPFGSATPNVRYSEDPLTLTKIRILILTLLTLKLTLLTLDLLTLTLNLTLTLTLTFGMVELWNSVPVPIQQFRRSFQYTL